MSDDQLILLEQALRLSRIPAEQAKAFYTLDKINEALEVIQAIPHSLDYDCEYCNERKEKGSEAC